MSNELNTILQQQLRDIHLPEAVTWWPLAIGWWIIIALTVIGLCILTRFIYKKLAQNRYRKMALLELQSHYQHWQQDGDKGQYLQLTNTLLKRVIKHLEADDTHQTSTTGERWVNVLNNYSKTPLSQQTSYAISKACYQAKPDSDIDLVHQQICHWLLTHKKIHHSRGHSHA